MHTEKALEARARRKARRHGLLLRKSRMRVDSIDDLGGFQIIDPMGNYPVAGSRFELSAEDVLDYFRPED